jgi:hypothetical protein
MINLDAILSKEQKEAFVTKLIQVKSPGSVFTLKVDRTSKWDFIVMRRGQSARVVLGASIGDPKLPQLVSEIARALGDIKALTSAVAMGERKPVTLEPLS